MIDALDVKVAAARAAGAVSRRAGRGGTSLPGKLLMRLEPHAIGRLAARLPRGSAVISATNGKTTTAAMLATILERGGRRLVHNRAGANMAGGVASALAGAARRGGRELTGQLGLFEVDEFWLGPVVEELDPRALLLANLPKVFKGTHLKEPGIHVLRGRSVSFQADRPFTAYADGDPIAELPTTIRALPGALRVVAPR